MTLLAVHVSDGVLDWPWLVGGAVGGALLLWPACRRVRDDEIPRIALLAAAFFVASSIHVRIPPTSVHLLLNGLAGVVLGVRAPLAIAVGLGLQYFMLAHGGGTTLGVNLVVMALPAAFARPAFDALWRGLGKPVAAGFVVGFCVVVATASLNALVLVAGGVENFRVVAVGVFLAHLPVAAIEGSIVGVTAGYLARVNPALLGRQADAGSLGSTSSSGTSH